MSKHVSKARISTAPGSAAYALLQEVANINGAPAAVLERARLPCSLEDLSSGRVQSLPSLHFAWLCRECVTLLEQHASRHGAHPPLGMEEVQMLCYCVINCKTLAAAIERAARFCAMLGGRAGQLSLAASGTTATFQMRTFRGKKTASALISDLFGLSFYHRLFSWLIGERIELDAIEVAYPALMSREAILELFQFSPALDAEANSFRFPARYLTRPVVRSYDQLVELLDLFPFDLIDTDLHAQRIADALHNIITAKLAKQEAVPTIAQLASLFNLSSATFRRRLDEEQTSIKQIKEKCRRELAVEFLRHPALTLEEIAARLGFSDAGAFRRAFKRWTGVSPSDYRQAL
jgi:AraC-like DNA-binding protein